MGITEPVRSAANPRLKAVRRLRAGQDREHLLLEGEHLLEEALGAGVAPEWVLHAMEEVSEQRRVLLERARAAGVEIVPCEARLLKEVSDLSAPAGIMALGPRPAGSAAAVLAAAGGGIVVVASGVQDPGNLGALVRSAAALGAGGIIALRGGVSVWHPRALRGASGTTFRLPVADRVPAADFISAARGAGCAIWEAAAGGKPLAECRRSGLVALLLGEEGSGVPEELAGASDCRVGIPMQRGVESLNVAVAAAVLLHALGERR